MLDNLWLGGEEGEAVASALVPKLQKTKAAVQQLLFEVATLEVRFDVLGAWRKTDVMRIAQQTASTPFLITELALSQ